jgi:prepilin-type N-terminal cleavage/methylation domain-containing protein
VRRRGVRGFSLVEVLVALLLFLLAAAFAVQLLMETAQQFADAAAEQVEAPLPLMRARIRGDVQAAIAVECQLRLDGSLEEVRLIGHPAGIVLYRLEEGILWREVEDDRGKLLGESVLLREVDHFGCGTIGSLLHLQIRAERRAVRRTPLVVTPEMRGSLTGPHVETLLVVPRGAGLESGW